MCLRVSVVALVVALLPYGLKGFYQRCSAKISGKRGFDFLRVSVLLMMNFFFFRANFLLFSIKSFLHLLRSLRACAVSFGLVLLRVSLCPLWFKRFLSAFTGENQRQKGFDFLRVSVPQPALERSEGRWILVFWLWLSYAVVKGLDFF